MKLVGGIKSWTLVGPRSRTIYCINVAWQSEKLQMRRRLVSLSLWNCATPENASIQSGICLTPHHFRCIASQRQVVWTIPSYETYGVRLCGLDHGIANALLLWIVVLFELSPFLSEPPVLDFALTVLFWPFFTVDILPLISETATFSLESSSWLSGLSLTTVLKNRSFDLTVSFLQVNCCNRR